MDRQRVTAPAPSQRVRLAMQSDSIKPVEYRDVVGFPGYRIGDDGSVWSSHRPGSRTSNPRKSWRKLSPALAGSLDGRYPMVGLTRDRKRTCLYVHILVLTAFVGPCPSGLQCCHEDDDPENNNLSNLRWDTPVANASDRARNGFLPRGENNGNSKLSDRQRKEILDRYSAGGVSQQRLGEDYGVHQTAISHVIRTSSRT